VNILVTNDDGIFADGIYALRQELLELGDVIVIAPETEQSAVGHAITLLTPLRTDDVFRHGEFFGYAVNGTPADCVKLGVHSILDRPPDLIVSGVNLGSNLGTSVIYSGTVSAATEGTILGIPSIAVSLATFENPDFSFAARFACRLARIVVERGLPHGTLLNVNVPAVPEDQIQGVEVTYHSASRYEDVFERRLDPRHKVYYWQAGLEQTLDLRDGSDAAAVRRNSVSITPIHFDMTNYDAMSLVRNWTINL